MTDAERALIEACLASDKVHVAGGTYGYAQAVALERISPAIRAELKEALRAHLRAQRAYNTFADKLPQIVMAGEKGLVMQLYDEIDREEGWS